MKNEMITCPTCNKEISINSKRCVHCGNKITWAIKFTQGSDEYKRNQFWIIAIGIALAIIYSIYALSRNEAGYM